MVKKSSKSEKFFKVLEAVIEIGATVVSCIQLINEVDRNTRIDKSGWDWK